MGNQKTEVVLYKSSCMLGSRLGTLWLTYDHLYFHSSILGFTKQKVWSLYDVNAVWKSDGLISGISIMVGIHSSDQIDLTIPTNCDNVYTVIDQLLRMHRGDIEEAKIRKESGQEDDLPGLSSTIFGANPM